MMQPHFLAGTCPPTPFSRSTSEHLGESLRIIYELSYLTDMPVVRGLLLLEVGKTEEGEKVLGDGGTDTGRTDSQFDFLPDRWLRIS
jgi:hypothetical protein